VQQHRVVDGDVRDRGADLVHPARRPDPDDHVSGCGDLRFRHLADLEVLAVAGELDCFHATLRSSVIGR
jgi:hypothetical protein